MEHLLCTRGGTPQAKERDWSQRLQNLELVVGEPGEKVFRGDRMVWLGSASLQFCGQKRLFALLFLSSGSFRSFVTGFFSFSRTDSYARVGDAW